MKRNLSKPGQVTAKFHPPVQYSPTVSFCIPCYNAGGTIERCLDSVLAEAKTVPGCEILLVDNASTDNTLAIARKMLEGITCARIVVNEKNLGRIENWNRCLELARGQWLRFAMTNNVILGGSTQELIAATDIGVAFVYSDVARVDKIPNPIPACPALGRQTNYTARAMLEHLGRHGNITETLDGLLFNGGFIRQEGLLFSPLLPYCADFLFVIDCAGRSYSGCKKIDALTCLMDVGQPRFAATGLNPEKYYFEARQCADGLAEFLQNKQKAFKFLRHHYAHDYAGQNLTLKQVGLLFRGSGQLPPYAHAMLTRLRWARVQLAHFTIRILSKFGLWRTAA